MWLFQREKREGEEEEEEGEEEAVAHLWCKEQSQQVKAKIVMM
jgi:hypothetical protein